MQISTHTASAEAVENTFIDALVKACSCRQQVRVTPAKRLLSTSRSTYHKVRRRNFQSTSKQCRDAFNTRLQVQFNGLGVTRDDYRHMLDYYNEPHDLPISTAAREPSLYDLPPLRSKNDNEVIEESICPPVQPRNSDQSNYIIGGDGTVSASHVQEDRSVFPELRTSGDNGLTGAQKENFKRLQLLLEDEESSHEHIYEAYCRLPSPGVRHLSVQNRRLLLHRLSVIAIKTRKAMLRYLSIIDDMKEALYPLSKAEWNSAIAYAGRCFAPVQASEVETSLRMWKEMEHEAGVRSGRITFNILFDIATKAEKYILAEMILNEMKARGLEYCRFSHVGFIYYYGVRGDGAGVRRAYRDFVEAGQIVDTAVMNCVIASLIRAGELPAAEQVYERMKRLVYEKTNRPVPNSDWRYSRDLGRALDRASRTLRNDKKRLQRLQAEQCLAPNLRTFYIFLDHHVHNTGELRRVTALLEEMQSLQIPMHGRIFLKIFRGFACHGGVKYTSWTRQRLETVWESLLSALNQEVEGVHMMKWMVVWIMRAFSRCCGRDRTLQIWEQIRDRWKISGEDEKGAIEHILRNVLEEIKEEDWP
ncbi:MAG: hypothetical protein Q9170_004929 [Blastenia crenularia]